ncbi:hypothetical protein FKP32DRAFT_1663229 [Trametes sanguinea]|nr:hypothetical protein FKP32DRAFT_1663229 [Trametes sanguinea]
MVDEDWEAPACVKLRFRDIQEAAETLANARLMVVVVRKSAWAGRRPPAPVRGDRLFEPLTCSSKYQRRRLVGRLHKCAMLTMQFSVGLLAVQNGTDVAHTSERSLYDLLYFGAIGRR